MITLTCEIDRDNRHQSPTARLNAEITSDKMDSITLAQRVYECAVVREGNGAIGRGG